MRVLERENMFQRIKLFFLMRYIRKNAKGRGGDYAAMHKATEEIYTLSKKRSMTPEELERYGAAIKRVSEILQRH